MENRTNFDLNKNIEIWKSELSKNSKLTFDNINELESHLRDGINELQLLGLSIEESLLIAKTRIGNVEDLKTEFGKVNNGFHFKNRIIPYLKGILFFIAFITLTELITGFSVIIANKFGYSENLNSISIGILAISTLILLLISYKKYKNTSLDLRKLTSIPILVSVILVSTILKYISTIFITRSVGVSELSSLMVNLNVYKMIFGLFILILSSIIFYSLKRENKVKIAE